MVRGLVLAFAIVLAAPAAAGADGATLTAITGPGDAMTFVGPNGQPVQHLAPGTYTVRASDTSDRRDFTLRGPGVSVHTGFEFVGERTWSVTFTNGWYRYYDAAFEVQYHGEFSVGSPPAASLVARVAANGAISFLHSDGSRVTQLDAGVYSIAVHDESRTDNFRLIGPGAEEHTQVFQVVDYTWTLSLADGRYSFFSERNPQRRGSFTVGNAPALTKAKLLHAVVGPDFSIAIVDANWRPFTRLVAGRYKLEIADTSDDHDFHLHGPGVSRRTPLEFVGTQTWSLRLRAGFYVFRCDPHDIMTGGFSVKAAKKPKRRR